MGNVKLIIEIPEWYYEETKEFKHPTLIDKAIINGTPLDPTGEYIKKSDLMAKAVTETLSDYTEHDVVHADDIFSLQTYSFPGRPKGEWILKERKTECSIDIDIVCSRCGYVGIEEYAHGYELNELPVQEVKDFMKKFDMNFCPCCGCSMDKGASK